MSTLATLEGDVAGVLGLDFTSTDLTAGDAPRLTGWANDAVIDMLLRTHCYISTTTLNLASGTGDYQLDSGILAITDLYQTSSGAQFRLRRLASTDLINLRLFSVATSPVQMYATDGANLLMLYPAPQNSTDTLSFYYVPKPTPMSSGTHDPSNTTYGGIPTEFHYGLELYMQWKAGDAFDDATSGQGETYRREYLGDPTAPPGTEQRFGFIGTMKRDLRNKGGKHLGGVLLPPRSRRIYVPNPGVDVGAPGYD